MKEGVLTLAGTGRGPVDSMQEWLDRRLAQASLVLCDPGADPRLLERIPETARRVDLGDLPEGAEVGRPAGLREEIRNCLLDGRNAVRLYGEALFHSESAFEEIRGFHARGLPFEAVAGQVFLDDRALEWRVHTLQHAGGVLILPCRPGNLRDLRQTLRGGEYRTGVSSAFLREGTLDGTRHRIQDPEGLGGWLAGEEALLTGLVLLGETSRLQRAARWFTRLSLLGLRVLVTRAEEEDEPLSRHITERGGEPLSLPCLAIGPPSDEGPLVRAIDELDRFHWIVFTSRNGVRAFFDRLLKEGRDARAIGPLRLACVGASTAEALHARGLHPDLVPEEYAAEPLGELLRPEARGHRFLLPLAEDHRETLPQILEEADAEEVRIAPAYRNTPPPDLQERWEQVRDEGFDVVAFTSSSTVRHLAQALETDDLGPILGDRRVVCIGPVTAGTARKYGLEPAPLPSESTLEALAVALASGEAEAAQGEAASGPPDQVTR